MKAVTVNELGVSPALSDDIPAPEPGPREVLVRVQASSVNPVTPGSPAGCSRR
jgi:NADPH:quinone reductase-like Zn-dependent oxidoreductase